MKIKRKSNRFLAAFLSLGMVAGAVAGSALMAPAPQAKADSGVVTSGETEVVLNLLPTISLATEDIDITLSPNSYGSGTATLSVDSNAANGYSVYLSTETSTTALTHETDSTKTIPSVTDSVALSTFQSSSDYQNLWGFVKDSTIKPIPYLPLTNCNDPADDSEYETCLSDNYDEVNGTDKSKYDAALLCTVEQGNLIDGDDADTCDLTIGVKVDTSIPSGIYSNTIVVTVVPNLGS